MYKDQKKNHASGNPDMPYEKFFSVGPEHLTEKELLAIILRTGVKDADVLKVAEDVLALSGQSGSGKEGLLGLCEVSLEQLLAVKGIGQVKAVRLKCLTELSMRISRARARPGLRFRDPRTVADYFMEQLRHRDTECVILVSLDGKGQLLKETFLSSGSVKMSLISPREVFLEALRNKAVSILLIHNHPSGDPTPSVADRKLTENLREMGEKLDIRLTDHIIIGDNCYSSFKELSYL
ncbi:MAG: DNA repair protein RadC [Clostridium sp.]|jgi:DNA repair protein RadC|nr:DNA repair protein RadC [Clostridium sp.]